MKHDEFIGEIVNRLSLPGRGEGIRATRAVLQTLGERIQEGQARNLAGALPLEIDVFLTEMPDHHQESFDTDEFVRRVAERMGMNEESEDDLADAAFVANVVFDLVHQVTPESEMHQIRRSLKDDYHELFELMDARDEGKEIKLGQGREETLQGLREQGRDEEADELERKFEEEERRKVPAGGAGGGSEGSSGNTKEEQGVGGKEEQRRGQQKPRSRPSGTQEQEKEQEQTS